MLSLDYRPKRPLSRSLGIGVVGAGEIMVTAHLPAYRAANLRIVAITDRDVERASRVAQQFGIPTVSANLGTILSNPEVDLLDVAIPAADNPIVALQAISAGRHLLLQKPMAESSEEANRIVDAAQAANVKLAVNHQMRWAPSVRAAGDVLRRGMLGDPQTYLIDVSITTDWSSWPWLHERPNAELWYHTIHYLDATRYWFGDPEWVSASLGRHPGSLLKRQSYGTILLRHRGVTGVVRVFHDSTAPADDWTARFVIEGTKGRVEGRIGLLLGYPTGLSDVIHVWSPAELPPGGIRIELDGRWFPDAFLGPMSSLLDAIHLDIEPETSGSVSLGTLRLLESVERSSAFARTEALSR